MDSLRNAWMAMDGRRRIIVVLATAAAFAAVLGLARMGAGGGTMALLYAGLDGPAAGGVVSALDQRGVAYEVRGDAIYVPVTDRDALRLALAGEGLPAGGAQGYELLDSLTGFGTTSQMFDAAYWRAKEGELARTILSVPGVQGARVHISTGGNRPFQRQDRPTAAVTVTTGAGSLSAEQARALRHLVAAAVSGLDPADVTIIDGAGNLIGAEDADLMGQTRAAELRARAERLLEARVGYGNAVVEVTVETVTDTESIIERTLDPDTRVAISTEVAESTASASGQGPGAVTVASNLPDGDAGAASGGTQSEDTESRTTTNFDLSETSREILRAPGAIRRMTVAVLVNDQVTTAADGTVTSTPRTPDEMTALSELVASAVGLDPDRGDVITLRSMAFEPAAVVGTEATGGPGLPIDLMQVIRLAVLAAVALILGLFVVRPILSAGARAPALPPPGQNPAALTMDMSPLSSGVLGPMTPAALANGAGSRTVDAVETTVLDAEEVDPVTRLRRLIAERQDETMQILQNWIEDPDQKERV